VKRYEGALCREFDATLAVSEVDKGYLVEAMEDGAGKIHVIPIAVDCKELRPIANPAESREIVLTGTLFYPPNADGVRWFMREVWPLVRRDCAEARMTIVGPRPPRDIQAMAAGPGVTVTGYVPDLQPVLERAALTVVPVRAASGMRVRILEALACSLPIVTTTMGVEGIEARDGEQLLIADEPARFAAAVVRLLGDWKLRQRLAANGRRLAEEKYDWQVVLPKLETLYESLLVRQAT
jgi:glycosyltransferase involved in cell wall biosynthesis